MKDLEKLGHLLHHWIEHNEEHAETYRAWAEKADSLGKKDLSAVLERLYHETKNLNTFLEEAKRKLG
ncbi:MAG TPA: hypothetical protein VFG09_04260 [Thermodesulfovibrionales bacterium]|nr:hypothetical protein [Thermodesulfovibrionales bacterium]